MMWELGLHSVEHVKGRKCIYHTIAVSVRIHQAVMFPLKAFMGSMNCQENNTGNVAESDPNAYLYEVSSNSCLIKQNTF